MNIPLFSWISKKWFSWKIFSLGFFKTHYDSITQQIIRLFNLFTRAQFSIYLCWLLWDRLVLVVVILGKWSFEKRTLMFLYYPILYFSMCVCRLSAFFSAKLQLCWSVCSEIWNSISKWCPSLSHKSDFWVPWVKNKIFSDDFGDSIIRT